MNKLKQKALYTFSILVVCLAVGFGVNAYMGNSAPKVVVEGNYIEAGEQDGLGAVVNPYAYPVLIGQENLEDIGVATITPKTLTVADSGKVFLLSASGTAVTLPSVAAAGTHFTFIVDGALDTTNYTVTSAEGDNIEGSLVVAGAVVNCDAADVITIVIDGENIGDFFEVISTGTYWVPLQSGALTTSKLTCTG